MDMSNPFDWLFLLAILMLGLSEGSQWRYRWRRPPA
jgi:hypothetical protein